MVTRYGFSLLIAVSFLAMADSMAGCAPTVRVEDGPGKPLIEVGGMHDAGVAGAAMGGAGGDNSIDGGMSASGSGIGGNGGGGGTTAPRFEWKAANPSPAIWYTLPDWLTLESETPNKTSEIGPSELTIGFPPHTARPRNVGLGWGLAIESERTNEIPNSFAWKGSGWTAGTMDLLIDEIDPSQGSLATGFISYGDMVSNKTLSTIGVASAWLKGFGMGPPFAHFTASPLTGPGTWVDVTNTSWQRVEVASFAGYLRLETRDLPEGAGIISTNTLVTAFAAQIEKGRRYPSSYIPTHGTKETRLAEKLYSSNFAALVPNGLLHVAIKIAPHYATGETTSAKHDILYFDSDNGVYLRLTDNVVVFHVNGHTLESKPLTWTREQVLNVEVSSTPIAMKMAIAGESSEIGTYTGPPAGPMNGLSRMYILGDTWGAQECADLRAITIY